MCEHDPKDLRRAHAASPAVHLLGAPALAATAMTALGAAPKAATGALMAAPRAAAGALRAGGMLMGDLVGTGGLFDIHESFPPPGTETTMRVRGAKQWVMLMSRGNGCMSSSLYMRVG